MTDLSIIILSYNTEKLLDRCLVSIINQKSAISVEIIVVDNNSEDQSVAMVEKKYKTVKLVKNKMNLGYSAGNNTGIRIATGRNILLLNSDTELIGNCLGIMVKLLDQNGKIGIAGPKLIFPDKSIQKSAGVFYTLPNAVLSFLGAQRLGLLRMSPGKTGRVDWVSGACLMFKKELAVKAGLLDENLFMYMDEVEFCYRALQHGYETWFTPEAVVVHSELGGDKKKKPDAILNIYKGFIYFYRKYYTEFDLKVLISILKLKALVLSTVGRLTGNNYLSDTYGKAFELVK